MLWPKFEDAKVGMLLAVSGAIRDDILPLEEIAYWAMGWLQEQYPQVVRERYGVELQENPYDTLLAIAEKRGYKNGTAIDEKAADHRFPAGDPRWKARGDHLGAAG